MYKSNDLIIQMSFSIYSNPGVYAVLLGSDLGMVFFLFFVCNYLKISKICLILNFYMNFSG